MLSLQNHKGLGIFHSSCLISNLFNAHINKVIHRTYKSAPQTRYTGSKSKYQQDSVRQVFKPHDSSSQYIKSFERNMPLTRQVKKPKPRKWVPRDETSMDYGKNKTFIEYKKRDTERDSYDRVADIQWNERRKEVLLKKKTQSELKLVKLQILNNAGYQIETPMKESEINSHIEYIFGKHSVRLALMAKSRSHYGTLYHYKCRDPSLILYAKNELGLKVEEVTRPQILKAMTGNAVHNGIVLETRPLVHHLIHSMGRCHDRKYTINVYDSIGDNFTPKEVTVRRERGEKPLGVFLDGVTDPQNMGGIVRSCYFFGADFLVVPENNTARMGPIANKASAGALDLLPIYTVSNPVQYTKIILENGWNVVVTGKDTIEHDLDHSRNTNAKNTPESKLVPSSELESMLEQCPMLLILGSEGLGICRELRNIADYVVGLEKAIKHDTMVDSLNVNVAAGVLLSKCVGESNDY